ncbi:MAG: polysaccharide biosynthesis C-terminal domain-containing protein [Saprospiraceae bacterium]|nr:polysaccharide biosynthesis C-terminal domain-containing protein [Saprospiraceae bacterium]
MRREFLINLIFLIGINLLIKPFYLFGIDRTVQNVVEPGAYGLYFALYNFTFLFQILNDFGLQNFNNRNIAQHRHLLDKYFPNILVLKLLLAGIYLLAVGFLAVTAGYGQKVLPLLCLIAFNQVLLSGILFFRSNVSGLGHYRTDSLLSVMDRLLLILICGALLWTPAFRVQFKIEWFVLAQTAALGLTALTAFFFVYGKLHRFRIEMSPAFLWLILKKSYPYALIVFLMTAYTRIDGVMIERLLSDGRWEADLYASAYRLLDAGNMIGYLFASLLLPMFARLIKQEKPVAPLADLGFRFIMAGAIALALSVFFFRQPIMKLLYTSGSAYSADILAWLIFSFIAISGSYIYGTLLTAHGSLREMNQIFAAGVAINVGLNLILIPQQKAIGAAFATFITQMLVFIAQYWLAHKKLGIYPGLATWGKLLLFGSSVTVAIFFSSMYLPLSWPWQFLLSLTLGGAAAWMTGLVNPRWLWSILSQQK